MGKIWHLAQYHGPEKERVGEWSPRGLVSDKNYDLQKRDSARRQRRNGKRMALPHFPLGPLAEPKRKPGGKLVH